MMKYFAPLLIPLLATTLIGCDRYPHLETLEANREGSKLLQGQNAQGALDQYLKGLRFNPFQSELHLNLGLSFEILQQNEKAMSSYKEAERLALESKNYQVLFMALFNQAQLLAKDKKVDEAIATYQKALELIPSSKEVKTNIELLTQQQQGQGGGDGENKDQKDQNQDQNKDQQKKDGDSKDQKDPKDGDQQKEDKDKDGKDKEDKDKKPEQPKQMQGSPKYKPRPFQGKELSEGDVKKILGELKQQEEKIRAEFNRKEVKEQPRDKDW
ncbi:Tetratricopeptide repeat protein [compost metagenome]